MYRYVSARSDAEPTRPATSFGLPYRVAFRSQQRRMRLALSDTLAMPRISRVRRPRGWCSFSRWMYVARVLGGRRFSRRSRPALEQYLRIIYFRANAARVPSDVVVERSRTSSVGPLWVVESIDAGWQQRSCIQPLRDARVRYAPCPGEQRAYPALRLDQRAGSSAAEQGTFNPRVLGSNPSRPSTHRQCASLQPSFVNFGTNW